MPVTINGSTGLTGVAAIDNVSSTELGYVDGVTSAIQTQLNAKAADSSQGLYLITPSSTANSGGSVTVTGGAVAFSAVNNVSLNGVFSATYDNYGLLLTVTGSTSSSVNLRMRASGSDAATNYNWQVINANSTTVSGAAVTSQTSYAISDTGTGKTTADLLLFDPFKAEATNVHLRANARTINTLYMNIGQHTTATSYDGFTLIAASGTITGTVRVYGYKN
jgi:hypothetical protein